jgi:hypothetical protein
MTIRSLLLALPVLAAIAGCGPMRVYPLVPPKDGARSTFTGIAACAARENYKIAQHPDSVNVETDKGVWVQFMDQSNGFNMVIVTMDSSPETQAKADAAKAKGDALYQCALKGPGPR